MAEGITEIFRRRHSTAAQVSVPPALSVGKPFNRSGTLADCRSAERQLTNRVSSVFTNPAANWLYPKPLASESRWRARQHKPHFRVGYAYWSEHRLVGPSDRH